MSNVTPPLLTIRRMPPAAANLPRIYQANIDRLFQRTVLPALRENALNTPQPLPPTPTQEEFFDRLKAGVDFHTGNETRKVMALVLAATFERQLRIWSRISGAYLDHDKSERDAFELLLETTAKHNGVDLSHGAVGTVIEELHLVANGIRHGDGRSLRELRTRAPRLWDKLDPALLAIAGDVAALSENMLVDDAAVIRYATGLFLFWGLADKLPNSVLDVFY